MRIRITLVFALFLLISSCAVNGEPVEFAKACDLANDGKTLRVTGVLMPRKSVFCSNRGGRMECPFDFQESLAAQSKMTADIEVGSGANTMDEVPKGFKKEDLKVRDNNGNLIVLENETVKATGKMMIAPAAAGSQGVCLMQVYKLEK
ncbi:MAG: hypothetical protein PSX80_03090 [bacterium]|nr:hypothetical protein [bacterium]